GHSVHLLAYGVDEEDAALTAELTKIREGRSGRLTPVLTKLAALGVPVTEEEVLVHVGDSPSVGRPHIADALVAAGHVADRTEAFDRFLADGGPAHVPRYTVDLERGIDLVHQARGVAVIAHPWGRRRTPRPPAVRDELRRLGARLGVIMTGSSDYHGAGKVDHDLGCNTTDPEMFARLQELSALR